MTAQPFISCDPAIYAAGGFFEGGARLDDLRGRHASDGGGIRTETVLYGPAAYERRLPLDTVLADDPVLATIERWYAGAIQTNPSAPAAVLACIEDALVLDRAVHVVRDGVPYPLYETHRRCDLGSLTWTDAGAPAEHLPDTRDYLLLTSSGTFNWGHWLVDDLPRLKGIRAWAQACRRVPCVLLHGFVPQIDRVRVASLKELLGPSVRVETRLLHPNRAYRVRELRYVSPVSFHPTPKHPGALADLAEAARDTVARRASRWWRHSPARPTKIFVTRRPERGRVPVGLDDIRALALRHGFTVVDPDGASAFEQMAAFSGATQVAGFMGAAMTNTVFCTPGARILHLAPDSFLDPFYWDLAAARGHGYAAVYGPVLDPAKPAGSDYRLDPARLERAFGWLA
jgi:capsular polysaccharide biosynthesis protein